MDPVMDPDMDPDMGGGRLDSTSLANSFPYGPFIGEDGPDPAVSQEGANAATNAPFQPPAPMTSVLVPLCDMTNHRYTYDDDGDGGDVGSHLDKREEEGEGDVEIHVSNRRPLRLNRFGGGSALCEWGVERLGSSDRGSSANFVVRSRGAIPKGAELSMSYGPVGQVKPCIRPADFEANRSELLLRFFFFFF